MAKPARVPRASRDLAVATVLALLSGLACWFVFDVDSVASWLLGIPFAVAAGIAAFVAWRPDAIRSRSRRFTRPTAERSTWRSATAPASASSWSAPR